MEVYLPTINDLQERYSIARSNVNNRITGLKQKGYRMEPGKQDNRNVYAPEQLDLMDRLDEHIKGGGTIGTFPAAHAGAELDDVLQDKPDLSRRTQDTTPNSAPNFGGMVDAIANKVAEILQFRQQESPQLPSANPAPVAVDPLEKYRRLQEVVDAGYLLSSSDLEVLLDRKSLPNKDFDRYGFKFSKAGRNGGETAWRVSKSSD